MINLIPQKEKRRLILNLYYRLSVLFLWMVNFCVLIAFVCLIPSYFISSVKNTSTNTKLEVQKNQPLPLLDQQTLDAGRSINDQINLIKKSEKNQFIVSEKIINAILLHKRPDVKISQIFYENDPVQGRKVSIIGIAPSREILLLFRQSLGDNPAFKSVDLPISNFIKGSNIQFNLNLIPA